MAACSDIGQSYTETTSKVGFSASFRVAQNPTFEVVSVYPFSAQGLAQQWQQQLQPVPSQALQKARTVVLEVFASIAALRQAYMKNPSGPRVGFFYCSEVCAIFLDGKVPLRLQRLHQAGVLDQKQVEDFCIGGDILKTARSVGDFVRIAQTSRPVIADCGSITSLLQMYAAASISPEKISVDRINPVFLGFPPSRMDYIVEQAYYGYPNSPCMKWAGCDLGCPPPKSLQVLDMCYLKNDDRYQYPDSKSRPSAFKKDFSGESLGWWLTYVGKNENEEDLYIGFGGDEGPKTLEFWEERLKRGFVEKWETVPEDWACSVKYYPSPIREEL